MSFINLFLSDVWTEQRINGYVAGLIRGTVSAEDELKAARLSRKATQTDADLAFVAMVDSVIAEAVEQGRLARQDARLLDAVLAYEKAFDRVHLPAEPEFLEVTAEDGTVTQEQNPAYAKDQAERAAAQDVLDNASADTVRLFCDRNPPEPTDDSAPAA